jgi:hypothetical protein
VKDNDGHCFPPHIWENLKNTLVDKFGGVTAYTRSPAEGIWSPSPTERSRDQIFTVEVIVRDFDTEWWQILRRDMQNILRQDQLLFRVSPILVLD